MKKFLLFLVIFTVVISSCKKLDSPVEFSYKGSPTVGFTPYYDATGQTNSFGFYTSTLQLNDSFVYTNLTFKLSNTTGVATSDIKIYFSKVNGILDKFNADNSTNITSIEDTSQGLQLDTRFPAVILKGTRTVNVPIKINPVYLDIVNNDFGLGLRIDRVEGADIDDMSDSMVVEFAGIPVPNAYAGDYDVTGYFFHPSSPRAIATTKTLVTVSPTTSLANLGDLGGSGYQFQFDVDASNNLKNWSAQGSTPAAPASGFMTLDNPAGISTYPGSTSGYVSSTYNNTYNPTTKTFYMHYGYQSGGTSQLKYQRQVYEKWVHQ